MGDWYTYILVCRDLSYYVGITSDLKRRLNMHNQGTAAEWTKQRRPVRYVYVEKHPTKSCARKRELELKGWRREKKEKLFLETSNLICQKK
jgi:putative endonuclease